MDVLEDVRLDFAWRSGLIRLNAGPAIGDSPDKRRSASGPPQRQAVDCGGPKSI